MAVNRDQIKIGQVLIFREYHRGVIINAATWLIVSTRHALHDESILVVEMRGYYRKEINDIPLTRTSHELARPGKNHEWSTAEYIGCPKCCNALKAEDDYLCKECRWGPIDVA